MKTISLLALLLTALGVPCAAATDVKDSNAPLGAPSVITSGNATVSWDTTVTGATANCNFTYSAIDHCFQHSWFFRAAGDTQETQVPIPDNVVVNVDELTASWNDVAGRGLFSAELTLRVFDAANGTAEWRQALTITALSPAAVDLRVFHYVDFDLAAPGADTAVLVHANDLIEVSDEAVHMFYRGVGADVHEVRTFDSLRAALLDTGITELANTGLPFAGSDFTGALQWNHRLVPGYPVSLEVIAGLNRPAMPQGSTVLNFDEVVRPDVFTDIVPASSEYAANGIGFGLVGGEGMGFLDMNNFGSTDGESVPNALAFNDGAVFQGGTGVGTQVAMQTSFIGKRFEVRGAANLPGDLWMACLAADRGVVGASYDYRDASTSAEHLVIDGVSGIQCTLVAPTNSSGFFDDLAFTPLGVWSFSSLNASGCNLGETIFNVSFTGLAGALPFTYETIVRANGLTYMHEAFAGNADGATTWFLYASDTGGPINGTWPLPPGTPIEVTAILHNPEGGVDFITRLTLSQCDGGVISSSSVVFDAIFEDGYYGYGNLDSQ